MSEFKSSLINEFGTEFSKFATERLESNFINRFNSWVNKVVNDFKMYNKDLNASISKIAEENKLNREQIKRIVEEVNVRVYLDKYSTTKGGKIRRVEFELADIEKVLGKAKDEVKEEKKTASSYGEFEKVASYEEPKIDFMTSSVEYMPKLWDDERLAKERRDIITGKVIEKIAEIKEQNYKVAKEILWKIARVGDSLISYARMGEPIQEIFTKLAQDAQLDKYTQQPIREHIIEKSASMKKQYKLASNIPCNVSLVTLKETPEYSLGKFSLMKEANTIEASYPDILVNGHLVTYNDLVSLASDIKEMITKVG